MEIADIRDGKLITAPDGYRPVKTNRPHPLLDIGRTDDMFFKSPNSYYFDSMNRKSLRYSTIGKRLRERLRIIQPIRRMKKEEHPSMLEALCVRFPELAKATSDLQYLHFLLLFKLQYEGLKKVFGSSIPHAAFVLLDEPLGTVRPAVAQQAIKGHTLLEMVDQDSWQLLEESKEKGRTIGEQLESYISSPHLDFYIANFVFSVDEGLLY